ncbi:MAG: glycosyltransferase [Synechococcus sp.]|nr:glycosyltransferase [Synechococcus sp.]
MARLLLLSSSGCGRGDGIAAASDALLLALQQLGHRARLICLAQPTAAQPALLALWIRLSFLLQVLWQLLRLRPDQLIVCHLHLAPVALMWHRLRGVPYSVIVHGLELGPSPSRLRQRALLAARARIAVSRWSGDRLRRWPPLATAPISRLPNTFRAGCFHAALLDPAARPQLRAGFGLDPGLPLLLSVCRLAANERYKGVDRVLLALPELLSQLGPLQYVVAGRGDDLPRLQALAGQLGLEQRFRPIGFVPDAQLPLLYALADVFALPSCGEGFGIVFLEALACGTPVLAGNRDGSVDALAGGHLGLLVDPFDQRAIAGGLRRLLLRQGPRFWFDRRQLSAAVCRCHGPDAYRRRVEALFGRA